MSFFLALKVVTLGSEYWNTHKDHISQWYHA